MNRIFNLLLVALAVLVISCRNEKNREIFESYEGEEGIYMVKLPPAIFLGMMESESGIEDADLGNIDFVKVLVFDESVAADRDSGALAAELREKFDNFGYELAIRFTSSGNDISAYMLENNDYISDLMVLIQGNEGLVGLGLSGKLDSKSLMKFASEADYENLGGLVDLDGFTL